MKPAYLFPGMRRMMLDLTAIGLPEVPVVGIHRNRSATAGLSRHVHDGLMEICYLVSGQRIYQVDGRHYMMRGNDVFLTYPDEPHGSGDRPHGRGELYWMQVRLSPRANTFLTVAGGHAREFITSLARLPHRHFRGDRQLQFLFEEVYRLYHDEKVEFRQLRIANCLVAWLLKVAECANRPAASRETTDIRKALTLIETLPAGEVTITTLAEQVGLSVSRFKVKFKEQTGIAPAEYILRSRIDHAKVLLQEGRMSVTEIAYALGFSSSQYFATAFKRFTTMRPVDVLSGRGNPLDA